MDVSVIIVNYNTEILTLNCINSIFEHSNDIEFEIILVDNNSTDGSINRFSNDKRIKFIRNIKNLGFGKANNLGSVLSTGKYLFLLNSDTILLNNSIKCFYEYMELYNKDNNIGVIGGELLDINETFAESFGKFPSKKQILYDNLARYKKQFIKSSKENIKRNFSESVYEVEYIIGADMFIPKKLFDELNGFDSDFFMYFEDADLQYKMSVLSLKRFIISGTRIIHLEGGSMFPQKINIKKRIIFLRSMFLYFQKHSKFINYKIFRILFIIVRLPFLFESNFTLSEKMQYFRCLIIKSKLSDEGII